MNILSIGTQEYDVDIEKLLKRRLRQAGWEPDLAVSFGDEQVVSAEVDSSEELSAWIMAIGRLLLKDMAHFEMARAYKRAAAYACPKADGFARGNSKRQIL